MADTFQFDFVTPEQKLVSAQVREVRLPGAAGDLSAMPGHAPLITSLHPGFVTVVAADGTESEYGVTGGFAEITPTSISLLVEHGMLSTELTAEAVAAYVADARKAVEEAAPDAVDAAVKLLSDMEALGSRIGS